MVNPSLPGTGVPAVFLDRDGTIVKDPGYLRDPAKVELLPGAGAAIARLNAAGLRVIVVTNQSGIGRGKFTEGEYRLVARRVEQLLGQSGATIDATYFCPHLPGACTCRKPGLALFQQAIAEHRVDPARSCWVGDKISDLLPAAAWGGRGLLVETGEGPDNHAEAIANGFQVTPDLAAAVEAILATS
jgi:histidinol-phosphate phosphatase family protein